MYVKNHCVLCEVLQSKRRNGGGGDIVIDSRKRTEEHDKGGCINYCLFVCLGRN